MTEAEEAFDKASRGHRQATEKRAGTVTRLRTSLSEVSAVQLELAKLAEGHKLTAVPSPTSDLEPADSESGQLNTAAAAAATLRTEIGTWMETLSERIVPLRQASDAAEEKLNKAKQSLAAADTARAEADRKVTDTNTALASETSTHEACIRTLRDSERRLVSTLVAVDERWRGVVDLADARTLSTVSAMLKDDQEKVDTAVAERDATATDVGTHQQAIHALERERAAKVTAPLSGIVSLLVTLTEIVNDLAARLELPQAESIDEAASPQALVEATKRLESSASQAMESAAARADDLRGELAALVSPATEAVTSLAALVSEADPTGTEIGEAPDPQDPLGIGTRDSVQRIVGGARRLAKEATTAADQARNTVKTAKDLDKRIAALSAWRVDLDGAIDVLKKDNFPTWARNVRIADLVDIASEILSEMTGSRYRFDSALRISDEVAGIVRKASTLSGGEKFEASLALALGVSEIAGRSGVRIDTLFLDEGFAGLDQSHLNRALDTLENEVQAGRSIVLITHIGSVADRIPDVLLVRPDAAGGSTMNWLNDDERFELGADLDLAVP